VKLIKTIIQSNEKITIAVIALFLAMPNLTFAELKGKNLMTTENKGMRILSPEGLPSSPGPEAFFTGTVTVTPLIKEEDPSALSCGCVVFQPGARSAWHTHPKGQLLIINEGSGFVQEWGKPIQKIKKGDMIWTPPGVKHWHGATASTSMTQSAVQESLDGKNVNWLEKVSDEQYRSGQN
jgi:quercetin dioxygenase-like cupin family protein